MNKFFTKLFEKPEYLVYGGLAVLLIIALLTKFWWGIAIAVIAGAAFWFGRWTKKDLENQIALMKNDANELHEAYSEKVKQLASENEQLKAKVEELLYAPKKEEVDTVAPEETAKPKKRKKQASISEIKTSIKNVKNQK